jgi:hypothetical protein
MLADIKKELNTIKAELYVRRISRYDNEVYPKYALQVKDGFQIVSVISNDSIEIDAHIWDNVFMVPGLYYSYYPFEIGVQKGEKYGYYVQGKNSVNYLLYDGIYFYYKLFYYEGILFSGTQNEESPYTMVKKGYVYSNSSYSKTNWLKWIVTPPNWPAKYQGRAKWRKFMKEDQFLMERMKNSNT